MTKRLLELEPTSLFGENAIVTSLTGTEQISRPFEFSLEICSPLKDIRPGQVIGKPLAVRIDRENGKERYVHGYISYLSAGDYSMSEGEKSLPSRIYRVTLVPWTWFLTHAARCFVYLPEKQEKSLKDVLDEVLKHVAAYGHVQTWHNAAAASILSSRKFEHVVQYRETDFNFLSRTLERHGIFYYFKHEKNQHTMILCDQASYLDAEEKEVRYAVSAGGQNNQDHINAWEHAYEFVAGKWSQTDYDFQKPSTSLHVGAPKHGGISIGNAGYELYDNTNDYVSKEEGRTEASRRMEEEEARFDTVHGSSTCKTFAPGFAFKLVEHPSCPNEQNKSYVITSITHHAAQPGPFSSSGISATYSNSFQCIPRQTQYRPPRRTPQPVLSSVQTAVVVGPPGEEIYTDKYGRVKVQFHWDQIGKFDQNTSCWIRCQQSIAGNKWGFMAIPRVGQEVVVDFIEGDPDRPLITGCVYNAEQMPAYDLPSDKAKTYIKTNSTRGGDGHNELQFDDVAGNERLYMHAQKDMDIRVLNESRSRIILHKHQVIGHDKDGKKNGDQRELVYQDKHLSIKRHQTEWIEGHMQLTVGGGEAKEGGDFHLVIDKEKSESVGGDSNLMITGNHSEQIDGTVSSTVGKDLQIKCGANTAVEAQEIHIKAGMKIILEAGAQISLVGPGGFVDIGPAGVSIQGIMVNINSGGSAGSGTGCKPKKPKKAKKAQPLKPDAAHDSKSGSKSTRR